MNQTKIERLLRLITMLAGNTEQTIEEISTILNVMPRSIYRYIETLKNSGFVVEKIRSNVYKLSKMPNGSIDFSKLIYFSEEEAHIINTLIHSIDNTNQLKRNLQKKLAAIYRSTNLANIVCNDNNSLKIEALGKAIQENKIVILKDYESAHSSSIQDRTIEPFAFSSNYIDIWGFDLGKNDVRVFKVSRIKAVETTGESWKHADRHQEIHTDCFRMNGKANIPIQLELSIRAKNLLLEEYPLAEKDLTEKDGKWILRTQICSLEGAGRFVIGLADDIKIIDSPELEKYILEYAEKHILSKYKKENETTKAPF